MTRALAALLCAGLLARATHGQDERADAATLAPPPPPPPPPPLAAARTLRGPRPRIHIYDLPDSLTKPCFWWGCGRLTQEVRKSKARRAFPRTLAFSVAVPRSRGGLTPAVLRGQPR